MATLHEVRNMLYDTDLLNRIEGACVLQAIAIRKEEKATANHELRMAWAKEVAKDSAGKAKELLPYVIADAAAYDAIINKGADNGWKDAKVVEAVAKAVDEVA